MILHPCIDLPTTKVSRPREGGGRWAGAASISRMTYHEWGMARAPAPAGSLTPALISNWSIRL